MVCLVLNSILHGLKPKHLNFGLKTMITTFVH